MKKGEIMFNEERRSCNRHAERISQIEGDVRSKLAGKVFRITGRITSIGDGYKYLADEHRTCTVSHVWWYDGDFSVTLQIYNKVTRKHDIAMRFSNSIGSLELVEETQ